MKSAPAFTFLSPDVAIREARVVEGMHVADFHAASGFFTRAAARAAGASGCVWAVDPNRDLLVRIKHTAELEHLDNIEIVRGNVEHKGGSLLPEGGMDLVMIVNGLFMAEGKEAVIEEAWRVLKPSGKVLAIDWQDTFGGLGPPKTEIYTREMAQKAFVRGGFMPGEDIPAGDYHWGMLLKKKA